MAENVIVPEYITVHLGTPASNARNVTVPFVDYIKNVASSEIYPTWPENALRANIIAQISIALNRVYNEYYRSQGYDFDITNSTQFDQAFQEGRDFFLNISEIVDEIFNTYVVVEDSIQPYYTEYCDGINVTCRGLSQWGTVALANEGYTPYEILQYYFGENINLKKAQPSPNIPSYNGVPLHFGLAGQEVLEIQRQLNRIARNYPLIPTIPETDGVFDIRTENAVKTFQSIFNLQVDGIVGEGTWYAIKRIYNAVKRLSELYSEGITISEAQRVYPYPLRLGDSGVYVRVIQFYLDFIAYFNNNLPRISADGVFGQTTQSAVEAFQQFYSLNVTGVVDSATWYAILNEYNAILKSLPYEFQSYSSLLYPGYVLTLGAAGKAVEQLQTYLLTISENVPSVPSVTVDGVYGEETAAAVEAVQRLYGLPITGDVGVLTWNSIVELYNDFRMF